MRRFILLFAVLLAVLVVAASLSCGGSDDESGAPAMVLESTSGEGARFDSVQAADAPLAAPIPTPMMAPTAAPAPAAARAVADGDTGEGLKVQASPQMQTRVIVHTAYVALVVGEIAGTVDWIASLAQALGGWVVSSDRTSLHNGAISIRIPAASLEDALSQLEGFAVEVESRTVTSQDVTDQYVDFQSRLVSMRATEGRLLSFLEKATDVEDALDVHQELASLQVQIEEIQGRLNFLEQTSAYSLIDVSLKLTPQTISVDAGEDVGVKVGKTARFRASFLPPQGIEEYQFTWDFGDGSMASGSGTVLRPDGRRVTATVNHVYGDDLDSPYIVRIDMSGFGESGVAEGTDALEVVRQRSAGYRGVCRRGPDGEGGPRGGVHRIVPSSCGALGLHLQVGLWRRFAHGDGNAGRGQHPFAGAPCVCRLSAPGLRGAGYRQRHERRRGGDGLRFLPGGDYGIQRPHRWRLGRWRDDQVGGEGPFGRCPRGRDGTDMGSHIQPGHSHRSGGRVPD